MELFIKLVLSAACLSAMVLGLKMVLKKVKQYQMMAQEGLIYARTILASLILSFFIWWLIQPDFVSLAMPTAIKLVGTVLFTLGWCLRVIAQIYLGEEWSNGIKPRNNGKIVTRGPYFWVRHPIYASYLLVAPGLFAMTGNLILGGLATTYMVVTLLRIKVEEQLLNSVHPKTYQEYAQITPAIFICRLNFYLRNIEEMAAKEKALFGHTTPETIAEISRTNSKIQALKEKQRA